MAVTKRTRFEVLRRDDYTCRYCGAKAAQSPLTIDHVVPLALGGTDAPDNLVAACRDCNYGKGSTNTDAETVARVAADAARWAEALAEAARRDAEQRQTRLDQLGEFKALWHSYDWTDRDGKRWTEPLPPDWQQGVEVSLDGGLTMADLGSAIGIAMHSRNHDTFRYFMGVCRNLRARRAAAARTILAEEVGPDAE